MSDLVDFIEFVDIVRRHKEVAPRRYLRDYSDPFTKYSVHKFHARYGFTPETIKRLLLPLVAPDLRKSSKRGLPFPPEIMLLLTLRYYVSGSFQKMDGDFMNVCQQSVSRIIARISTLIANKMKDFVKFPSTLDKISTIKQKFYEIANFPEVVGCIGCTHIKIKSPGGVTSELYRNRKGWFSINVQAVTGPNLEFYDLVARWPGSTHDSFIYNNSSVNQKLNTGAVQGIILGDSRYAVSNVLLTPFLSPSNIPQENYNKSLIKTRDTVERCFGIWKRRFSCLQVGMGIKVDTVVAVVCACATLHNIALLVGDLPQYDWEGSNINNDFDKEPIIENLHDNGFLVRQSFVDRFFS